MWCCKENGRTPQATVRGSMHRRCVACHDNQGGPTRYYCRVKFDLNAQEIVFLEYVIITDNLI